MGFDGWNIEFFVLLHEKNGRNIVSRGWCFRHRYSGSSVISYLILSDHKDQARGTRYLNTFLQPAIRQILATQHRVTIVSKELCFCWEDVIGGFALLWAQRPIIFAACHVSICQVENFLWHDIAESHIIWFEYDKKAIGGS